MRSVHLVVPDLFLPCEFAAEVCAGLRLPVLEKMLARGCAESLEAIPLEQRLSELFGLPADAGVAAFSAAFDGLGEGNWLRADPVHLQLQRDRLVLHEVGLAADEAAEFCTALNRHFSGDGLEFFAPHPQRWYVRASMPEIRSVPLSQAVGRNVRELLPRDGGRWGQLYNEIQMLLFAHGANERREERGELPVNSVWLWGGGRAATPRQCCREASSDEVLVEMFAAAAEVPFHSWSSEWRDVPGDGEQLVVWNGLHQALMSGDIDGWHAALQAFEAGYVQPLWQALRSGRIAQVQLESGGRRITLGRADSWALWRRSRPLGDWAMV